MNPPFFFPTWPPAAGIFLWYGVLLLASEVSGEAVYRWLRLPRLLGWVIVGMILGPNGTGAIDETSLASMGDLLNVAAGIVLFELGQRVDLSWLRRNPWLLGTSVLESALSFGAVFLILQALEYPQLLSSVVAAIAVATSPAVTLALTRDLRAQGQVTERMLLLTSLNSIYTFLSTSLLFAWIASEYTGDWMVILGHPVYLVLGSVLLAASCASATLGLLRLVGHRDEPQFMCVIGMVIAAVWGASALNLSVTLTLLAFGTMMRNFDSKRQFVSLRFGRIGRIFLILLFSITAAHLDVRLLPVGALAGLAVVVFRFIGKGSGIFLTATASGLPTEKAWYLTMCMTPKSGLAVMLVLQTSTLYPEFGPALTTVAFTSIIILETIGPLLTQYGLRLAGETFEETPQ